VGPQCIRPTRNLGLYFRLSRLLILYFTGGMFANANKSQHKSDRLLSSHRVYREGTAVMQCGLGNLLIVNILLTTCKLLHAGDVNRQNVYPV